MSTSFTRLDPVRRDHDELVEFMTGNEFPFHGNSRTTRESIEAAIGEGAYRDVDNDSFWIDHIDLGRIGFFRLEDLSENTPVFDLRLQSSQPFRTSADSRDRPGRTTSQCAEPSSTAAG